MKKLTSKLFVVILMICNNIAYSQQIASVKDSTYDGTIRFALISGEVKKSTPTDSKEFLRKVLKSGAEDNFYLYKTITDDLGMTHEKYQQVYNGIKVEFYEFIVHKSSYGQIVSINGDFAKIPKALNIKPKFAFDLVLDKNATSRKIKKYSVNQLEEEKSVENPITQRESDYEIVIVKGDDEQWHLAYKANLTGETIFDNFYGYIDCETSEMVKVQPLVYKVNATGTGSTLYSGNRTIITDLLSGSYRLQELNRGSTNTAIRTFNYNRNPAYYTSDVTTGIDNAANFTDNDNNWTTAEFNNANQDIAAIDVHWASEMTFDYFHTVHNRVSYDGNNGTINNYVHVRTRDRNNGYVPIDMDNAFWLQSKKSMFYGDGQFFSPTVSIDICAHELGHGICNSAVGNNGAGLTYEKESGALNESLSDIWGACVEQWATTGKQTWICGEDVFWGGARSMSNPNLYNQPDTYLGTNWFNTYGCTPADANDKCGVHTNSGVGNFWFFLLAQGGTGTNDIGNSYFVDGIGIEKAARIVYRMENNYLLPNYGYLEARNFSINAAVDLYGADAPEVISVTNAWYAVGVGNIYQYTISGPSALCFNQSGTFSIKYLPAGATVSWSTNGLSPYTGTDSTFTASPTMYTGSGYVRATVTVGQTVFTLQKDLTLNGYIPIEGPDVVYLSQIKEYFTMEESLTVLNWRINGQLVTPYNPHRLIVLLNNYYPGDVVITCTASAECGTFEASKSLQIIDDYEYLMYPNPATDLLTVSLALPTKATVNAAVNLNTSETVEPYSIQLWNERSGLVKTVETNKSIVQIPLRGMSKGMYYIHVIREKNLIKKQILWIK